MIRVFKIKFMVKCLMVGQLWGRRGSGKKMHSDREIDTMLNVSFLATL